MKNTIPKKIMVKDTKGNDLFEMDLDEKVRGMLANLMSSHDYTLSEAYNHALGAGLTLMDSKPDDV